MVFNDLRRFIFWASIWAENSNLARHSFRWRWWWRAWMSSCSFVPVPGRGVEPPLSAHSVSAAVNGTTGSASSILEIPKKVSVAGVAVVIVAGCTIV